MSKIGSHCSFRHLKHKLWPVWFPTTKSQKSTWFTWLQKACDISLERSQRELQLCFRLHLYWRSNRKVMGLSSHESPNLANFGGSPGTKSHLDVASVESHIVYYKGEGGGFPQVRAMVSLVCPCCPWFILAPKVLQLCTNHFVLVLCRPVWVDKACQLFLVSSRSSTPQSAVS
jgi:hypothetical protein